MSFTTRLTPARPRMPMVSALCAVACLGAALPWSRPAAAQPPLTAYVMVDQWPERTEAAEGLLQQPIDLDGAADGRAFIADQGAGGIHTLLADGTFGTTFGVTGGYPAQLGRVGQVAVGPNPGREGEERVYVLDTAVERVAVYSAGGVYEASWPGINGQSLAASSDGRLYVLDRDASQVVALDALTGARRFAFGSRGTEDGSFTNFGDISVAPDGRVVAVTDKGGLRVQLFDVPDDDVLAAAGGAPPATLRRTYDLLAARFNKGDLSCRGSRVNALGADRVFVGQGTSACLIEGSSVTFAIAASAGGGTICRATVRLPSLRADTAQYLALATYDPNSGSCGSKRTDLPTTPVIVRYDDQELRSVRTIWHAAAGDSRRDPVMFAPQRLSMPSDDVVFVQDNSSLLRFYSTSGEQLATAARDSSTRGQGTDTTAVFLVLAEGSETLGEVYGAYVEVRRQGSGSGTRPGPPPGRPLSAASTAAVPGGDLMPDQGQQPGSAFESGIGRFRTVERPIGADTVEVIEPIWRVALSGATGQGGRMRLAVPALAFNRVTGELLVVRSETVAQQRSTNIVVTRYAPDGTPLGNTWDVPDDGTVNPYVDISVGPDGRVYLLDDMSDVVLVLEPDGTPALEVPVAPDARAVAGGPPDPEGSVFALRETGVIERHADDGRVTARLDGRPLPHSDPTTLTDLVVDASGRVYVADGQSSLISVFAPTADPGVLPVPNDGECLFRGHKSAAPTSMDLGRTVTVELGVDGRCAVRETPSDIVIVAPYYRGLVQGVDPSAQSMANLLRLASRVDFGIHRMGLVTYYTGYTVNQALSHDAGAYDAAVRRVQRFDPPNQDVKARLASAMNAAAALFDPDSDRRKVMVLVEAQYCDPAHERFPGQCAGYPPAEATAQAIRDSGVTVVVVQNFAAANLASSDDDFVTDSSRVHRRMVDYQLPPALALSLTLIDEVPGNMTLVPSTVSSGGEWAPPAITWRESEVDFGGVRHSFDLVPQEVGRWPTNIRAVADVVDGWGASRRLVLPVPEVEVIGPTPSPTVAVPTVTQPPPTEEPPAAPTVHHTWLPWLANRACGPAKGGLDVVLAIDVSNSMAGGGLDEARDAARLVLDGLDLRPTGDRAALVAFAYDAHVVRGLSADRAGLLGALEVLPHRAGTRIDGALAAALGELDGPNARPAAGRAIVLLSDGGQTEAPDEARSMGRLAAQRGVAVYTVGVGTNGGERLLVEIAGDAARHFGGANGNDLAGLAARMAAELGHCR